MKKRAMVGFLGLLLGIGLSWCPSAGAADNVKFYLGAEGVYSFTNFKAGGYNLSGDFDNTGTDLNKIIRPGAHLGLEFSDMVNFDFGFHYRGGLHFTTDSYIWGPVYYYQTDVDAYSLMFSIFLTPMPSYVVSPYLGVGIGGTKFTMKTDDTVVNGSVDNISFTWQVEGGLQLAAAAHFALRVGYRYLNLGKSELNLREGSLAAGNFTGDLTAHEIIFGLRLIF
jgi:opacity protein-like surface antigen